MANLDSVQPLVLVDLDDTLFQTKRKMQQELGETPYAVAALDRSLEPRSFMNQTQYQLVQWLSQSSELVPVTARGTAELARVQLPFQSWAITTHGAVILQPDGTPLASWQRQVEANLAPYQQKIKDLELYLNQHFQATALNAWTRINYEYAQDGAEGICIYLVMKHRESAKADTLHNAFAGIKNQLDLQDFYLHQNDNNIAILPKCIDKGRAVAFLFHLLQIEQSHRPTLGFGDSMSDLHFLKLCHWFGTPHRGQLARMIHQAECKINGNNP